MDKSWMSPVAGVLDIVTGIFGLVGFAALIFVSGLMDHLAMQEEHFPFIYLQALFGSLALGVLLLSALAIIGGAFALRRSRWGWMIAGAIAATILCPPLGIASVILTVMAEHEQPT